MSRFVQEAKAAAATSHPNILSIHDVGTHDGAPYVVSELLEDETLRERLGASLKVHASSVLLSQRNEEDIRACLNRFSPAETQRGTPAGLPDSYRSRKRQAQCKSLKQRSLL